MEWLCEKSCKIQISIAAVVFKEKEMKKILLLTLILVACMLYGQSMQGIYTIGGASADYEDLDDAIQALHDASVEGDIYFYLNPGTYTGPYVIENLNLGGHNLLISSGSYSSDQVIFTNSATGYSDNHIILIQNSSNISIDDFDFAPTGSYARSIVVVGNSDNIRIQNNRFFGPESSSGNMEAIYFACDGAADSDNVEILFNQFFDGSHHIVLNNTSSLASSTNWDILGNTHQGLYNSTNGVYSAISLQQIRNLEIRYNTMHNVNSGISISALTEGFLMTNNRINSWAEGINLTGCTPFNSGATPNVYNNIVRASGYNWYGGYGSRAAFGLVINQCTNIYAAHNSVELSSADSGSITATIGGTSNIFHKNQLINYGAGYVLNFNYVDQAQTNANIIDFNNIYGRGRHLGRQQNTYYQEMADMIAELGYPNMDFNPYFVGEYLTPSSAYLDNMGPYAGVDVDFFDNPRSSLSPDIGAIEYSTDPSLTSLSGSYSIGIGGDFETISDFAYALSLRGIVGSVTGLLSDPSYSEQIVYDRIPGIGHDRWVTLKGNTVDYTTITYSDQDAESNYILATHRSKYLKFERLNFLTDAQVYSGLMAIKGFAKSINIMWCNFTAPTGISATDANSSLITTDSVSDLSVVACLFEGNGNGANLRGEALNVGNTTFSNLSTGLRLNQVYDPYIDGNGFYNVSSTAITANGISEGKIFYNRVFSTETGISVGNSIAADEPTLIANNFIGTSGGNSATGIWLSGSGYKILNNSVHVEGGDYSKGIYYANQLGSEIEIVNNIFVVPNGLTMDLGSYNSDPSNVIDYNSYYTESNYLLKIGSSTYESLAAVQNALPEINAHSVSFNPLWDEDLNIQSQYLRGNAQTRSEFTDDINGAPRIAAWDMGAEQQFGVNDLAPLSGHYSVGAPDSDFPTVEDCLWALKYHGINGSTFFNLVPGTYDGGYLINSFPRSQDEYLAYFRASGNQNIVLNPTSDSSDDNFLFMIVAASNVNIMDINLSSNSSTHYVKFFRTTGRCNNITFHNLSMNLPIYGSFGIHTGSSLGDEIDIRNCEFSGPGTGIVIQGSYYDSNRYQNVIIRSNTFNGVLYPIDIQKADFLEIAYNVMNDFYQAIDLSMIGGFSVISRNRMFTSSTGSSNACVAISNVHGSADPEIYVILNIIYLNSPSSYGTGLSIFNSSYLQVLHNTVVSSCNHNINNGLALNLSSVSNSIIRSNVFSAPKAGYALSVSAPSDLTWEGNAYFSNNNDLGRYNNALYRPMDYLESQLMDYTGIYANSLISENGYNSCSYLRNRGTQTILDVDIDNNPWGDQVTPGANVITDSGEPFTNDISVGPAADFENLESTIHALMNRGAGASITVNLAPGVYNTNTEIGHIPGIFGDSYVLFKGPEEGTATLTYGAASAEYNYVLKLTNTKNLRFEDLTFTTTNPDFGTVLNLNLYNEALSISNCEFYGAGGTSSNSAAVYGYNSNNRDLAFVNNIVQNLGYGFSVYDNSDFGSYLLAENDISDVNQGFSMQSIPFLEIVNNSISSSSNALSLVNVNDFLVDSNVINSSTNNIGIYISASYASTGGQDIFNNFVQSAGQHAVSMHRSANARLYHNTLINTNSSLSSGAFTQQSQCPGLDAKNNIFVAAAGSAASFNNLADIAALNNNIYHSSSGIHVKLNSQPLNTYPDYYTALGDYSSMYADPLLEPGTYLLHVDSPAIDAAALIPDIAYDIEGKLRELPDIGCYEYIILALDSPTNLHFIEAEAGMALTWDAVSGADFYTIYFADTPDAEVWDAISIPGTVLNLSPTVNARFFKVKAIRN